MEPSIIKGIRFSNADDTRYNLNPAHEIENLRTIINQLKDKLSQCNLECDTEKVAKRAAQRELASVKVLLKNIQEEQCFRWTRSDQLKAKRSDVASTNPFELDFDENGSSELSGGSVSNALDETEISINGLESILNRLALHWHNPLTGLNQSEKPSRDGSLTDISRYPDTCKDDEVSATKMQKDDIGGVGLILKEEQGLLGISVFCVEGVIPGSSAGTCQRIAKGDILFSVDNQTAKSKKMEDITKMIVGPVGSTVILRFLDSKRVEYCVALVRQTLQPAQQHGATVQFVTTPIESSDALAPCPEPQLRKAHTAVDIDHTPKHTCPIVVDAQTQWSGSDPETARADPQAEEIEALTRELESLRSEAQKLRDQGLRHEGLKERFILSVQEGSRLRAEVADLRSEAERYASELHRNLTDLTAARAMLARLAEQSSAGIEELTASFGRAEADQARETRAGLASLEQGVRDLEDSLAQALALAAALRADRCGELRLIAQLREELRRARREADLAPQLQLPVPPASEPSESAHPGRCAHPPQLDGSGTPGDLWRAPAQSPRAYPAGENEARDSDSDSDDPAAASASAVRGPDHADAAWRPLLLRGEALHIAGPPPRGGPRDRPEDGPAQGNGLHGPGNGLHGPGNGLHGSGPGNGYGNGSGAHGSGAHGRSPPRDSGGAEAAGRRGAGTLEDAMAGVVRLDRLVAGFTRDAGARLDRLESDAAALARAGWGGGGGGGFQARIRALQGEIEIQVRDRLIRQLEADAARHRRRYADTAGEQARLRGALCAARAGCLSLLFELARAAAELARCAGPPGPPPPVASPVTIPTTPPPPGLPSTWM